MIRLGTFSVTITPVTPAEYVVALRHADIGTVIVDCDGDIWTKNLGYADDGLNWLRKGDGWASAEEVAQYAPFQEVGYSDETGN